MKVKIQKSVLLDALKKVQNIVPAKGSLPVLQNAMLVAKEGKLAFTSTDLDLSIIAEAPCEVLEEGATTLPVKLFASAISKVVDGTVEVNVDEKDSAVVKAGTTVFRISGLDAKEFPVLPKADESSIIEIQQSVLKDMIKKTNYASSKDDTRRTLCGNLFSLKGGKLTVVATDGRRLAVYERPVEADGAFDLVVPNKTIGELLRNLNGEDPVRIAIAKTQVVFELGTVKVYSKLMDDAYPNYNQVIPKETQFAASIDRQLLTDAIDRVSIFATSDSGCQMKFKFAPGELSINSTQTDLGEAKDQVAIKYDGPEIEISFNPFYLMDPLKEIGDDDVVVNLNDGHSPAVVTIGSAEFKYVLMPLRIQ